MDKNLDKKSRKDLVFRKDPVNLEGGRKWSMEGE
jgi:hypothetical protein